MIYTTKNSKSIVKRAYYCILILISLFAGNFQASGQETEKDIRDRYEAKARRLRERIDAVNKSISDAEWELSTTTSENTRMQTEKWIQVLRADLNNFQQELNGLHRQCENEINQIRSIQSALEEAIRKAEREQKEQEVARKKQLEDRERAQREAARQKAIKEQREQEERERRERQRAEDQANYTKHYNESLVQTSQHYNEARSNVNYNTSTEAMNQRQQVAASMRTEMNLDDVQRSSTTSPPPVKSSRGLDRLRKETNKKTESKDNDNKKVIKETDYEWDF